MLFRAAAFAAPAGTVNQPGGFRGGAVSRPRFGPPPRLWHGRRGISKTESCGPGRQLRWKFCSTTASIETWLEVLFTCGRVEIFSARILRKCAMSRERILSR